MTGRLFIDGKDAYSTYGIFIVKGGYNKLVPYPPLKPIEYNEWPEEDGIEPDLSSPALASQDVSISFACHGTDRLANDFLVLISDKAYHEFNIASIGRRYTLRLSTQQSLSAFETLDLFTIQFVDDFPLYEYEYLEPSSSLSASGYEIDDIDLSAYGIQVLQGSFAEILKSPAVKKNLLQDFKKNHGAIYDGEEVFFQTKDVKLNCLMRADTLEQFWRNYDALLYDLVRPDERILYVDSTLESYPCYYKNCTVTEFEPFGKIWFRFTLTLVFTCFRVGEDDFVLSTEDDIVIETEDGEFLISLKPDAT